MPYLSSFHSLSVSPIVLCVCVTSCLLLQSFCKCLVVLGRLLIFNKEAIRRWLVAVRLKSTGGVGGVGNPAGTHSERTASLASIPQKHRLE